MQNFKVLQATFRVLLVDKVSCRCIFNVLNVLLFHVRDITNLPWLFLFRHASQYNISTHGPWIMVELSPLVSPCHMVYRLYYIVYRSSSAFKRNRYIEQCEKTIFDSFLRNCFWVAMFKRNFHEYEVMMVAIKSSTIHIIGITKYFSVFTKIKEYVSKLRTISK